MLALQSERLQEKSGFFWILRSLDHPEGTILEARPRLLPDLSWLWLFTGPTAKSCTSPAETPNLWLIDPAGGSDAAKLKPPPPPIKLQMDEGTTLEVSPGDGLTLSHRTDLRRREKFCPSFGARRSGAERERFASGGSSWALGCYWELAPPLRDGSSSLVSLALRPAWMEEICSTPFSPSS